MPGCWQDWNGLEEGTEVTEGIGMGGGDWKKFPHAGASGARRIGAFFQEPALDDSIACVIDLTYALLAFTINP